MQKVHVLLQPTEMLTQPLWVDSRRVGSVEGFENLELRLAVVPGALEQGGKGPHVVGAEDDVDVGGFLEDDRLVLLREAPAHGDLHGAAALALDARELAEVAVELVVGVLAHGARVDDHDVGVTRLGPHVSGGLERAAQPLGVMHVHLAAERAHLVGARLLEDGGGHVASLRSS